MKIESAPAEKNNKPEQSWCVYIIEASDNSLYTGITNNFPRRWQQHLSGKGGAKFFRGRQPQALRLLEPQQDRSSASRREAAIKKLSRTAKLSLIQTSGFLSDEGALYHQG